MTIHIFCDFDGTITETDNIASVMKHFVPEQAKPIIDQVLAKEIAIKDGVEAMFHLLPTSSKDDILNFLHETAIIREGFADFVAFTKEQGIPFSVVSGGIDFFVETMLAPYGPFNHIFCNGSDFSGDTIQVLYPYACDEQCPNVETQACGCCKPSIMRSLVQDDTFSIVIGDSVTDFEAAKHADLVFARDILIDKCEEMNIAYRPFTTFNDCLQYVKEVLEVKR